MKINIRNFYTLCKARHLLLLPSLHFIIPFGKLDSLVEQIEISGGNRLGLRRSFHHLLDFLCFLDLAQRPIKID